MVKTRSQIKYEMSLYEVNIDFDDASEAWKSNKLSIGNGSYKYVCCNKGKNNKTCIAKCLPGENFCRTHLKTKCSVA
jgi:hypothetical protein